MLTLGNKLNRSYSLYLPFNNRNCEVSILFNKNNSYIGFNIDHENHAASKRGDIVCYMFSDITKSSIASTFLDTRNVRNRTLDIKQQFHSIKPEFKDKIQYECNETIKVSKVRINSTELISSLYVYSFRFPDFGNDLVYILAERQHIDVIMKKKIVRTAAVQLTTNEVHEDLLDMIQTYNRQFLNHEKTIDDAIDHNDIFVDRPGIPR